jgi:predicted TIM-barrel enzyme
MNRIQEVFGVSHVLLPVVHPTSWDEALHSISVAATAGVRGIFLIDQGLPAKEVLRLVLTVRERYPSLWVGVNLLAFSPTEGLRQALDGLGGRLDGLWADNAAVDENADAQPKAQKLLDVRRERGWNGLYFGGVAFKYQRQVAPEDLGKAARTAAPFVDVICTSGAGTGHAADPAKVAALRAGVGPEVALALASGVTDENVAQYLPHVNAFLVGTGIVESFGVLDPAKVASLHALIASYADSHAA